MEAVANGADDLTPREWAAPLIPVQRGEDLIWLTVETASMAPLLRPGDRIGVAGTAFDAIRPGDVAVIYFGGSYVVHRVMESRGDTLILRGDSCLGADPAVSGDILVGRVRVVYRGAECIDLDSKHGLRRARLFFVRARAGVLRRQCKCRFRDLLVRTSRNPLLRRVLRGCYSAAIFVSARLMARLPGTSAVYLSRSGATGELIPGASDLDVIRIVALRESTACARDMYRAVRWWRRLRALFPMLGPLAQMRVDHFEAFCGAGGVIAMETPSWKLVAGTDCRSGAGPLERPECVRVACIREAFERLFPFTVDVLNAFAGDDPLSWSVHTGLRKHCIDLLRLAYVEEGHEGLADCFRKSRERSVRDIAASDVPRYRDLAARLVPLHPFDPGVERLSKAEALALAWETICLFSDGIEDRSGKRMRAAEIPPGFRYREGDICFNPSEGVAGLVDRLGEFRPGKDRPLLVSPAIAAALAEIGPPESDSLPVDLRPLWIGHRILATGYLPFSVNWSELFRQLFPGARERISVTARSDSGARLADCGNEVCCAILSVALEEISAARAAHYRSNPTSTDAFSAPTASLRSWELKA